MTRKVALPFRHHGQLFCNEARSLLTEAGFELVCNDTGRKLTRDEQKDMIRDAYAIVAGTEIYDEDMLSVCQKLRTILRFGVGTDNFALDVLRRMDVRVGIIANHNAVAEFALTLILSTLKNIPLYDAAVRGGGWNRYPMWELKGKTVGIVGLGRIGFRLAELLQGFHVQIVAYDPFLNREAAARLNVRPVALEDLLACADVVSLHLPLNEHTWHIMDRNAIARMKDGAVLINTARGALVDEEALIEALNNGKLRAAGLDVYEMEPIKTDNPVLLAWNTVLAPHVSALSYETNYEAGIVCARSILQVAEGGAPVYPLC